MPTRHRFHLLALCVGLAPVVLAAEEAPVPVTSRDVGELLFRPERSAPAEVVPLNSARLSAEIDARILALPLQVGDRVAAGDVVARLDCRDHEARLAAERAGAEALAARTALARTQLERGRDLREARNISDEEVDRRASELAALEGELRAQRAAVELAELKVARCTVEAPYGAVVTERHASVGDRAAPGTTLVRLVQLDGPQVSARLGPAEAVDAAAAPESAFHWLGRRHDLRRLPTLPVIDPATRTVVLRFEFTGEGAPPGASGRMVWRAGGAHLPADLLVRRGGRLGVFLVEEGHARFHPLAEALEGRPVPAGGLPEGARVVVEGREALDDGDPVRLSAPGVP